MAFKYFGASDIGRIRSKNEDYWQAEPDLGVFAIADGIGGCSGGEIASKEAVSSLIRIFKEDEQRFRSYGLDEEYARGLTDLMDRVNRVVYRYSLEEKDLRGMGTTLSSIYFRRGKAYIAHVGDSRIYRFRDGELSQLTEDHSLANRLCLQYGLSKESENVYPYRHVLTNVLGRKPSLEPDIRRIDYKADDMFFLCSDGLTNMVSDQELTAVLSEKEQLEESVNMLISLANSRGGRDNITAVLIRVI